MAVLLVLVTLPTVPTIVLRTNGDCGGAGRGGVAGTLVGVGYFGTDARDWISGVYWCRLGPLHFSLGARDD